MGTITLKYDIGDKVFNPQSAYKKEMIECPDCLGTKKWKIIFPTGEEADTDCYTCTKRWERPQGVIVLQSWVAQVRTLTIGQLRYEDGVPKYMCEETGIGSGSVYKEKDLFDNEADAMKAAELKTEETLKDIAKQVFKKKYDFADSLGTLGYLRLQALEENKKMRRWLELIDKDQDT